MSERSAEQPRRRVSAVRDDALGRGDAVDVAKRIASGEVSSAEVVEAAIERVRAVDPDLHAVVHERFVEALSDARSPRRGVFAGVPTFVKDTDALVGTPLRMGSRALPIAPSRKSSAFVGQFLSTGLVCLGKTSLPELGLTATTESVAYGPTRNPWNLAHSTGGSSGGSAALVAAGAVPIAHANDGGGSIRIPASCCGLVGLKPSRGRFFGVDGGDLLPIDIIAQGVLTRSVRDTATFVAAAEANRPARRLPRIGLVEGPGRDKLRIGMFTTATDGTPSDPECVRAVEETARLCESLGHHVERIANPVDPGLAEDFFLYWGLPPYAVTRLGRFLYGKGFDRDRLEEWTLRLAGEFRANLRRVPGALRRLRRFAALHANVYRRFDLLLTPTLASPPVPVGFLGPDTPYEVALERVRRYAAFTPVENVSGGAAISLPLGSSTQGLPIGVHFSGPIGAERHLLELAFALEALRPFPSPL